MSIAKKIDKTSLTEAALAWLKSRGISKETAEKANLQSSVSWFHPLDREAPSILFPYQNHEGQEYAQKIRAIDGKAFICNGAPQNFFNLRNVQRDDDLIICEGEMDALSLMKTGYESVVSIPNGANLKFVDGNIDRVVRLTCDHLVL